MYMFIITNPIYLKEANLYSLRKQKRIRINLLSKYLLPNHNFVARENRRGEKESKNDERGVDFRSAPTNFIRVTTGKARNVEAVGSIQRTSVAFTFSPFRFSNDRANEKGKKYRNRLAAGQRDVQRRTPVVVGLANGWIRAEGRKGSKPLVHSPFRGA